MTFAISTWTIFKCSFDLIFIWQFPNKRQEESWSFCSLWIDLFKDKDKSVLLIGTCCFLWNDYEGYDVIRFSLKKGNKAKLDYLIIGITFCYGKNIARIHEFVKIETSAELSKFATCFLCGTREKKGLTKMSALVFANQNLWNSDFVWQSISQRLHFTKCCDLFRLV